MSQLGIEASAARRDDVRPAERGCDHAGCDAEGTYRAPRSRDNLTSYYWFCLDHVRQYNSAWNFFAGMSRDEIEAFQHANLTWHRPTWRVGVQPSGPWNGARLDDPFGLFGDVETEPPAPRIPTDERQALAVLDLPSTAGAAEVKARYKELVKRLHPDVNGKDAAAEERLKVVIEAYRLLARRRATARL